MSMAPPGSKDRQRDPMTPDRLAVIDEAQLHRMALHAMEYSESRQLALDERRDLLEMLGCIDVPD